MRSPLSMSAGVTTISTGRYPGAWSLGFGADSSGFQVRVTGVVPRDSLLTKTAAGGWLVSRSDTISGMVGTGPLS